MKIGLYDVDYHASAKHYGASVFPNIALAKIARYHTERGDEVEWYTPFTQYDRVYMSKIFSFSPDFTYVMNNAKEIIKGGTGYDISSTLPEEIDRLQPLLEIYPSVPKNMAYGFLTRGCPRKCKWCVVPRKEGAIRPYMDVDEIAVDKRKKLILMDNNILAAGDYAKEQLRKIIKRGYRIDFNQGLDARLVTPEFAELLAKIKWIDRRIRLACDTLPQIKECERAIELIESFGFKGEFFLYVMVDDFKGFEVSFMILEHWWKREQRRRILQTKSCAVYPHCQPYRDPDKKFTAIPQWQKDMAGWVNKRMIWTTVPFREFSPRKGFKCIEYFI